MRAYLTLPRSDDNKDAVIRPGTLRFPYAQTAERAPISCLFLGDRRLGEDRTISLTCSFKVFVADRVNPVRVLSDDGA